ncbi:class I SAM-dependent methyltransferase [Aquicoccus porphyridii]|uniref:Class I SAM-dependent methyltransferase n=1 Tax=Aquicoccus porphyridii TaxID=1852029 RepID=A0A5A9YYK1_9RHOB|nr:class I SAM-dependent methyltransferase [Aquicoccus porphyridii]KAA0909966.1 class I SAM-dependent methyltransferase [Aquicoccus porphyridii]RAI52063.1 class I SAM-dependent methyltransferase [Rhodobacteraceae bacterium AsT-22]
MPQKPALLKPSKAQVALWLAARPRFWPDFWRRTKQNIAGRMLPAPMGQGREAATAWAQDIAISEADALSRLGLPIAADMATAHQNLVARAMEIERTSAETLGGGGGINLIFRICEALRATTVVETGVAYGWSSLAILASIGPRSGHLYSVDMPNPMLRDTGLTGAVVPKEMWDSWTLVREPDYTGLRKILRSLSQIDFIHYDSDKSYLGRAASYRALWPRVRSGGVLMSDDITDNTAFRDFAVEVEVPPVVIHSEGSGSAGSRYVGLLKKP